MEKPRITEIKVRMDCNGCVQKIKKALHGINGIYDLYIDFPQQKLTVIGCADPEKIVKAIKKTRKIATICAHREQIDTPAQPSEPAPPEGGQSDPDSAESPATETAEPAEPSKDPPLPENPAPETTPSPIAVDAAVPQQVHEHGLKDVGNTHTIHHFQHDYGHGYAHDYSNGWHLNNNPTGYNFRPEPTAYVTHSYNTYKPFPSISETHSYNTHRTSPSISEHENFHSPPRQIHYSRGTYQYDDYHTRGNSGVNNITSIFSDENPNACRIV